MAAISFTSIFDIINIPLGFILRLCYQFTSNYGLALILFTIIVRAAMVPLAIKQQKSMAHTVRMQPKIQALQKKYANDKQKLSQAQMELYQEEGNSPFGGCLPMIIQLPIIYGLYNVIYKPLSYIVQLDQSTIHRIIQDLWAYIKPQSSVFSKMTSASQAFNNREAEIYASKLIPEHMDKLSFLPSNMLKMDFSFGPLDLSHTPSFTHFDVYLLIPLLCYATTFFQMWLTTRLNKRNNITQGADAMGGMGGMGGMGMGGMNIGMMVIMPLFTTWISFSVPAGIGFYWVISNLILLGQMLLLNKFYNPKKLAEEYERQSVERKRARMADRAAREARNRARIEGEESAENAESAAPAEPSVEADSADIKEKPPVSDGKLSKKQQMEDNRRRLAASREKEVQQQKSPPGAPHPPQQKKKKRRK